jgi:hypothetical protein
MNKQNHLALIAGTLLSICLMLNACGISGHWMNGVPSAGSNIKPYIHYWHKAGISDEQRLSDSVGCGAGSTLHGASQVSFSVAQASAEKLPDEKDDIAARERLRKKWKICMRSQGYEHFK